MAKHEEQPIEHHTIPQALHVLWDSLKLQIDPDRFPVETTHYTRATKVLEWAAGHRIRLHKSKSAKAKHPWHFSIIASNGKIVLPSEGYTSRSGALREAEKYAELFGVQVDDET